LIVSLLDLHPPTGQTDPHDEPLEIFEAGTGHGSLTLHLARAIHSFNQPPPPIPPLEAPKQSSPSKANPAEITSQNFEVSTETSDQSPDQSGPTIEELNTALEHKATTEDLEQSAAKEAVDYETAKEAYKAYLPTRRAVVQTLDISLQHSSHAQLTIRNFRHGLYLHNINFHTGTIAEYLSSRSSSQATPEPTPFLAHTILDLPAPHTYLDIVSQALKPNGVLVVFCPSITQIGKCITLISEKRLPFVLETVLELGAGIGVGGREWDVRAVKPRALLKAEAEAKLRTKREAKAGAQDGAGSEMVNGKRDDDVLEVEESSHGDAVKEATDNVDEGWEMICRPKVGGRVTGGGFLALWRRMSWERSV